MAEPERIAVDPALVERMILELAQDGAYGETGVWRTVYSPEWVAAMDRYAAWCAEAGLDVRRDAVGNVWGRLEGTKGGKAVVSGSHLDSQRPGGRYDGGPGAIAALVAIRTLRERFGSPKRPLEALALCEEEGSRFPSASFWGSRAVTGAIAPGDPETTIGYDGETIADAVTLTGEANHAGAFPMDRRRDPMAGAAEIISGVIDTAHRMGRPAVTTVGRMEVDPNGPAIVPSRVTFTVDARHPDPAARQLLYARHEALMREVAARRDLTIDWHLTLDLEPVICDPAVVGLLEAAALAQGVPTLTMASGAVHDTQRMAAVSRVAMVFVRSRDGRSHTPEEFSSLADCVAGIEVLAAALHRLAY